MEIITVKIDDLKPYEKNPRKNDEAVKYVKESIKEFGFKVPIIIDKNNVIVAGHTRYKASKELGFKEVPCIVAEDLSEEQVKAFRLADNKVAEKAEWNFELLDDELNDILDIDMRNFGFDFKNLFKEERKSDIEIKKGSLQNKFITPPFSILNSTKGYWKKRKEEWLKLGIESERGREVETLPDTFQNNYKGFENTKERNSVFDPVLCEIVYKWFNVNKGSILDPFAGGSVRGIVAEKLGYKYTGIDIRKEQIDANYENAEKLEVKPNWICDDSNNINKHVKDNTQDLIFTCPPYADLEVYSDLENDISNMDYEKFLKRYEEILMKVINKLKENRFACIVVGEIRDKKGFYRNFISETKNIFIKNGMQLYNEIIFQQPNGSAVLRASKQFCSYRKVVKIHENLLVFYKGKPKKIKENYKSIEIPNLEEHISEY